MSINDIFTSERIWYFHWWKNMIFSLVENNKSTLFSLLVADCFGCLHCFPNRCRSHFSILTFFVAAALEMLSTERRRHGVNVLLGNVSCPLYTIKTLQCAICYLLHTFSADNVIISCDGSCWWYIVREHISGAGSMVSVHWIRHMLFALRVSNLPCDVILSWYFVLLFHINCKLPVNVLLS